MTLIKRCLSFIFLKIILDALSYNDKYLSDIEFDNVYVTSYFRRIDARRKVRGSLTLLPFKKLEKRKFIDPYHPIPAKIEGFHLIGQLVKLLLEFIIVTIFVILDWLFYEVLDIIRRHAYMEYTQVKYRNWNKKQYPPNISIISRSNRISLIHYKSDLLRGDAFIGELIEEIKLKFRTWNSMNKLGPTFSCILKQMFILCELEIT